MRMVFLGSALIVFAGLAVADGPNGVPPRTSPSEYPAHKEAKDATFAAAIVPPGQVGKMFSPDIAKEYLVVEVAVYPEKGQTIDLKPLRFMLRVGERTGGPEHPGDVVPYTQNRGPAGPPSIGVTTESGVIYTRASAPANGRSAQNVEAYSTVAVAAGPSTSSPDPNIIADRLWDRALPEGLTGKVVAGYLYFPQYAKRRKSDALELSYSDDDRSAVLLFPK